MKPAVHRGIGELLGRAAEWKAVPLGLGQFRQLEGHDLTIRQRHLARYEVHREGETRLRLAATEIHQPIASVSVNGTADLGADVIGDVRLL